MTRMKLIRTLASWRPDLTEYRDVTTAYRIALKSLARRSVGYESASQLLITAGHNSERLRSEASFAALCGVSPVPASSGQTRRYRLNRGGDRAANSALHIIAIGRIHYDPVTQAYVKKRTEQGLTKLEIIRCLKRYIAREVYHIICTKNHTINQIQIGT